MEVYLMSKLSKKPLSIFGRRVLTPLQEAMRKADREASDDVTQCQESAVMDLKTVQSMIVSKP